MKRVVVQVNPDEEESTITTKVETVLSDDSAQMLLTTVLSMNGKQTLETSERMIEFLVRREIEDIKDGSKGRGLFDRLMTRVERSLLSMVYAECDHVQTKTAFRLGIDRNTLHKKLSKHKLLNTEQRESA